MADLLVTEELFLLLHDEHSGKADPALLAPDAALAGALLLDLAEHDAVEVSGNTVRVTGVTPDAPLLVDALAVIAVYDTSRKVSYWLQRLPSKLKPLQNAVGRSLAERGVLQEQRAKVMGLFPTTRWPEVDPAPERQLRAGLEDVLVRGVTPTPHQALLVPLLSRLDLVKRVVADHDRKQAKATAKQLTKAAQQGQLVSAAVSQTVAATQTAVLMAVMTPVIVTTVT